MNQSTNRFLAITLSAVLIFTSLIFPSAKTFASVKNSPTTKIISHQKTKNNQIIARGSGSATIVNSSGLIVTNNHVVEKKEDEAYDAFEVCLAFDLNKKPICEYTARLIARNRDLDLALLQINPQDIHGEKIAAFNFLPLASQEELAENDQITIRGFPDIGGETMTVTSGQYSGQEEIDGITYIKTDTDVSNGNSGGTALDADGNFIGIPTYVRHAIENLGYILHINDALDWINTNKSQALLFDQESEDLLIQKMRRRYTAEETNVYEHPYYPKFRFSLPASWAFESLERSYISAISQKKNEDLKINITLQEFAFNLTPKYLEQAVFAKIEKNKALFQNYKRTEVDFHDVDAHLISYTNTYTDKQSINYIIPYGAVALVISYEYSLDDEAAADKYEEILNQFQFQDSIQKAVRNDKLVRDNPTFEISAPANWYILENNQSGNDSLIASLSRPDNIEGIMTITHSELSESEKTLTPEKYLKNLLENKAFTTGFRLVSKNEDVIVDGLPGLSLSYTYQGEDLSQTRKSSEVYLFDEDELYVLIYDDLDHKYDEDLDDFKFLLNSFQNLNPETQHNKGEYRIGSLNYVFFDISYHRYEQAIANLKDRQIIEGFSDRTFRPEQVVNRADAVRYILLSKIEIEEKQGQAKVVAEIDNFQMNAKQEQDFADTWFLQKYRPYLRYARDHEIISGIDENHFGPYTTVTIAQVLKILLEIYEVPVWELPADENRIPWYKPYMDKGVELGVLPEGIYAADHELTRGELAYILELFMSKVE